MRQEQMGWAMGGLSPAELAAQEAAELPEREELSLLSGGLLGGVGNLPGGVGNPSQSLPGGQGLPTQSLPAGAGVPQLGLPLLG
jgi:hypothetical protein